MDTIWKIATKFDFYEDYCDALTGGYIDRYEDLNALVHEQYRENFVKYIQKEEIEYLKICPNLWPELEEKIDFDLEYKTSHYLGPAPLKLMKRFIHEKIIKTDMIEEFQNPTGTFPDALLKYKKWLRVKFPLTWSMGPEPEIDPTVVETSKRINELVKEPKGNIQDLVSRVELEEMDNDFNKYICEFMNLEPADAERLF